MNEKCPICGSDFKQVPAGVSKKTGKPYNAFVACSKMGCPGKPGGQTTYTAPGMNRPKEVEPKTDWDKISWGKCKHAYLVEAFKVLYRDGNINYPTEMTENAEKFAEQWADMSMRSLKKAKEWEEDIINVPDSPF